MPSFLSALFGRIYSSGAERELRGGFDLQNGLQAVEDEAELRYDVSLMSWLRSAGHVELTASAQTVLTFETYTRITGTFALGVSSAKDWTLGSGGATLVWGGDRTVFMAAVTALSLGDDMNAIAVKYSVDGTLQSQFAVIQQQTSDATACAHAGLLVVAPGDEVEVMIANLDNSDDATVESLSMVLVALAATS